MITILTTFLTLVLDGRDRSGKELLNDSEFLAEALGLSMIFEVLWMFIRGIWKGLKRK